MSILCPCLLKRVLSLEKLTRLEKEIEGSY
jgi:hypothetical protein